MGEVLAMKMVEGTIVVGILLVAVMPLIVLEVDVEQRRLPYEQRQ